MTRRRFWRDHDHAVRNVSAESVLDSMRSADVRVVIVSCVFPPEPVTSALTSADLAADLWQAGHDVTVITAMPSRPGGRLHPGFQRVRIVDESTPDGYRLIRTRSCFSPRGTVLQKLVENLSFGCTSAVRSALLAADVVYANTWPIFAAGMLTSACRYLRRVPIVLSVQDIHPEAAIAVGKLRESSIASRVLRFLDGQVARRASAVVTISEGLADFYRRARNLPPEKVHVVPNWMDETKVVPHPRSGPTREKMGISDRAFVVLYAGNIGEVAGVEVVVEAARRLTDQTRIVLVIAGDGSRRAACERFAQAHGLRNVRFVHPLTPGMLGAIHGIADLTLLPTRANAARTSVPSKLIAYMMSARPVLAAVDSASDTADILRRAGCGAQVPTEDPEALSAAIRRFASDPEPLERMGQRARRFAEQHFSRCVCTPRLREILEKAAGQSDHRPTREESVPCSRAA